MKLKRRAFHRFMLSIESDRFSPYTDFEVIRCIVTCARFDNHRNRVSGLKAAIMQRLPKLQTHQFARCTALCAKHMRG
jgi:hypothetical protein